MTRAFWQYPICRGPLDQCGLGSGHATTWARATLQLAIYELLYVLQYIVINNFFANKQLFLVFFFSSLSTKHNWRHLRHNHGRCRRKWPPSTPHEALRSTPTLQMDRWQPPELADVFWGGRGCVWPSTHSFVPAMMNCHYIRVFWGPYTPSTAQKIISACSGGCCPSIWCAGMERKASCGVLGGRFRRHRPWLAMVVLVNIGRWRLTSDQPTVGVVKIVYRSIYFIPT